MTRSASTPPGGLKLNPAFADALTDLVTVVGGNPPDDAKTVQQQLAARLGQRPQDRIVLVAGLTRSLADPAYLRQHLRHLRKLNTAMLPYEDEIPDERIDRLLRYGPSRLDDGECAWLALCPEQLHALRVEIRETLTPFWLDAVDEAMAQAAREQGETLLSSDDFAAQIRDRLTEQKDRRGRRRRSGHRRRMVPLGASPVGAEPSTADAFRPALYQGTWRLLAVPESAAHQVTAVLTPQQEGFELRFLNAPATDDGSGVVELRLVTETGVGDWVRINHGGFRFTAQGALPSDLVLDGRLLAVPVEAQPNAEPSVRVTLKSNPPVPPHQKEPRD